MTISLFSSRTISFNITLMVISYSVLAIISNCYPQLKGRSPTCYSPVCHSVVIHFQLCASTPSSVGHCVRLACLRHAASVHPEPGSNSPKKYILLSLITYYFLLLKLTFCSVFKEHFFLLLFFQSTFVIVSVFKDKVNTFFNFFFKNFFNNFFFFLLGSSF